MQYGDLTESQVVGFNSAQAYMIRRPSFVVWIECLGDPTKYVMEIDTDVAIESPLGRGHLNVGNAILIMNNEDGYLYSDGRSKIKKNARIKIWAGFDNLNIPIFTGIINNVKPTGTSNVVVLNCKDYMGLFQDILIGGSQYPNNTAKLLIESFCDIVNVSTSNISSTDETTSIYTEPVFEEQSVITALEEVCNSIFYTAYFDENGILNAVEYEYNRPVDFQFRDKSIIECESLVDTEIINDITIEYEADFFTKYEDQSSIDAYGRKVRSDRVLLLNSNLVSEKTTGSVVEELDYGLEAFKFTSANDSASIDCLHIKMKKDGAHGYINVKVYSDNLGIPGTVLATSQLKASDALSTEFAWEVFYLSTPIEILPSTDYWVAIDTNSVSDGTLYVQASGATALGKHAYYASGMWNLENNKQIMHRIRSSSNAQRIAEDIIRFYKAPHERIKITAPAVPQLQLLDSLLVDIKLREIKGHYIIEGRRHIITPNKYINIDTLRKVG